MKKLLIATLPFLLVNCYQSKEADLIIHNAQIYSCDEDFKVYEAMAIKDGKILEMGPEREILNGYKCPEVYDAQMMSIYPGFHDAHCHFKGYAETLNEVDLKNCKSFDEMVTRILSFEKDNKFSWTVGRGWDHTMWTEQKFPKNDTLNALFPDKPVAFQRVDGHAALVNQAALDIAGITPQTQIAGGTIEVVNGKCTGLLLDNAFDSVAKHIPQLSAEELLPLMQRAEQDLFAVGLTSINDAGVNSRERELYLKWYESGDLKIKDYMMLFPDEGNMAYASDNGIVEEGNLSIRSFKILADGALGSRGACLIQPYSDDPHNHGFLIRDLDEIRGVAEFAATIDYQINTHCIGDSANRAILNIYAEVIGSKSDHRWKIEHAQVLSPSDFGIFEQYNIIPSVQPTHCTSDMRWAEERLGGERVLHAYAYQLLLDKAGRIALGTDFPVENISPLETFYAAVARMDKKGKPKGGFQNENALSREDALRGMTIWAAYSNFQNHSKGSLQAGKDADFVILTKDIMKVPFEEILTTFVQRTYLQGKLVFSAE